MYDSMKVKTSLKETTIIADFDKPDGDINNNFEIGKYDFLGVTDDNLDSFLWYVFLNPFLGFYLQELQK